MKTLESTRRFTQTWCRNKGIDVVEDVRVLVPCASFNKKTQEAVVYLPILSSVNFEEWERIAYHESSHLDPDNRWHYDVVEVINNKYGNESLQYKVGNILIDNLSERTRYNEYRGRAQKMSSSRMAMVQKNIEIFSGTHENARMNLLLAMVRWDLRNRETWMLNFTSPISAETAKRDIDKKLKSIPIDEALDQLEKHEDVEGCVSLIETIANLVEEEANEQDQEQGGGGGGEGDRADGEGGGSPQPDDKENEGGEEKVEGGSGKGEKGEEVDEEGEGNGKENEGGEEKVEGGSGKGEKGEEVDEEGEGNGKEKDKGEEEAGGPGNEEEKGEEDDGSKEGSQGKSAAEQQSSEEIAAVIVSKGTNESYCRDLLAPVDMAVSESRAIQQLYVEKGEKYYIPHKKRGFEIVDETRYISKERRNEIRRQVNKCTLSRQLRRYLQLKSHGRIVHGVVRGKVSGKSLHKLYLPREDSQPRIFQTKEHGKVKMDTAVTLLVDLSGSMGTSDAAPKYCIAAASAVSLANVLNGLRVHHEILGFTEYPGQSRIYAFKMFGQQPLSPDRLITRFSSGSIKQDSNSDGESLQVAAERLMLQKQPNKILIVLSDGRPAGHYDGDGAWYLRQVVEDIEKHSPIHLVGIGVCSNSVKNFYSNCEVINDIDELPEAVLKTLKANLLS